MEQKLPGPCWEQIQQGPENPSTAGMGDRGSGPGRGSAKENWIGRKKATTRENPAWAVLAVWPNEGWPA